MNLRLFRFTRWGIYYDNQRYFLSWYKGLQLVLPWFWFEFHVVMRGGGRS